MTTKVQQRKILIIHQFVQLRKSKYKSWCKLSRSLAIFLPLLRKGQLYIAIFFTDSALHCLDLSKHCTLFSAVRRGQSDPEFHWQMAKQCQVNLISTATLLSIMQLIPCVITDCNTCLEYFILICILPSFRYDDAIYIGINILLYTAEC